LNKQNQNIRVSSYHLILKDKITKKGKKQTDKKNFVLLSAIAFSHVEEGVKKKLIEEKT
jgi:hypothetical protein